MFGNEGNFLCSKDLPSRKRQKAMCDNDKDREVLGVHMRIKALHKKRKIGSTSRRAQFVKKLWKMVNVESRRVHKNVYWVDQGTAFLVENMATFASRILPLYFSHNNLASFERQMNFYSFCKMGKDHLMPTGKRFKKGAPVKFKHTYFRKDAIGNLDLIVRKTCPMLHKNMESELEDLVHELKSLKKERKDLELKIRGLKMATSTGKMDEATKELLTRAKDIWAKQISEEKAAKTFISSQSSSSSRLDRKITNDQLLKRRVSSLPKILDMDDLFQIDQDDLYGNSGNTLKMFLEESSDNFEENSNDEDNNYVLNDKEIIDLEKEYNGNKDNGDNTLITNGNLQHVSKVPQQEKKNPKEILEAAPIIPTPFLFDMENKNTINSEDEVKMLDQNLVLDDQLMGEFSIVKDVDTGEFSIHTGIDHAFDQLLPSAIDFGSKWKQIVPLSKKEMDKHDMLMQSNMSNAIHDSMSDCSSESSATVSIVSELHATPTRAPKLGTAYYNKNSTRMENRTDTMLDLRDGEIMEIFYECTINKRIFTSVN